MDKKSEDKCCECAYWQSKGSYMWVANTGEHPFRFGYCRRHAPVIRGNNRSGFPTTDENDYCGDFRRKDK